MLLDRERIPYTKTAGGHRRISRKALEGYQARMASASDLMGKSAGVRRGARRPRHVVLGTAKDRHVLAAAVAVSASVVITGNKTDFASGDTMRWGVRALTADEFLLEQLNVDTVHAVTAVFGEQPASST